MRPRIRTLKPEMFSDERVGDLSHGARLLFIGLITMADDEGRLRELPDAIRGHVFPYDGIAGRSLTRWLGEVERSGMIVSYQVDGKRYIAFPHWERHQRINKGSPSELPPPDPEIATANAVKKYSKDGTFKKGAIPEKVRRAVARAAGAQPGDRTAAPCHWCGKEGEISWPTLADGRPGSWVRFNDLELDHVIPEFDGGPSDETNIVLACQKCNRRRGHRNGDQPAPARFDHGSTHGEDHGSTHGSLARTRAFRSVPIPVVDVQKNSNDKGSEDEAERALFEYWRERCKHPTAKFSADRRAKLRARRREGYSDEQIRQAIDGAARAAHVNDAGQRFDDLELICRTGSKLESFITRASAPTNGRQGRQSPSDLLRRLNEAEAAS